MIPARETCILGNVSFEERGDEGVLKVEAEAERCEYYASSSVAPLLTIRRKRLKRLSVRHLRHVSERRLVIPGVSGVRVWCGCRPAHGWV
jgi:hypothetical protein